MEKIDVLSKGELMEELLRIYFISSGYYVVRSVKYKYEENDITDIDIYLYGRSSSITRQRINVDVKNKKSPQVFERILWANGLMKLLKFESCIVATTDTRPLIQAYGKLHDTTILDGNFLAKLRLKTLPERLTEEELLSRLIKYKSFKTFNNKDWRTIYEQSKSKLLNELDFSGFNSAQQYLAYFIEKIITDYHKREDATRMLYIVLSHMLVIVDFISKDLAFLETSEKEKRFSDGFKFGNLGKEGIDKITKIAFQISGSKSVNSFLKSLESIPTNILKEFFSKNEIANNLFNWSRELENLGFKKEFTEPNLIELPLRGIISVMLDFSQIERKKFFDSYIKT